MQELLQKALIKSKGPFSNASIEQIDSVSGGCIHKAWRLQLNDGQQLFAKTTTSSEFPKLKFEASGLRALQQFVDKELIKIPEPLILEQLGNSSVLLLPWLEIGIGDQELLGKGLAKLHKSSTAENLGKFGWGVDGFIGSKAQLGGWTDNWGECFVNLRLIPQLKLGEKWGINISNLQTLFIGLRIFLEEHEPMPALVHGDLWGGNAAVQRNGKGVIFDPAIWWADREVDLAMTKLFGGFSHQFYSAYEKEFPLSPYSDKRVDIYNLYHLLNHANMFGGSYKNECFSKLEHLKKIIPI